MEITDAGRLNAHRRVFRPIARRSVFSGLPEGATEGRQESGNQKQMVAGRHFRILRFPKRPQGGFGPSVKWLKSFADEPNPAWINPAFWLYSVGRGRKG
jgi:hypothetical protein